MKYILCLLLAFSVSNVYATENIYIDDVEVAQEYAKETNTKLLLVFSADWCKYCVFLKDAIYNNINTIESEYTVCIVDYDNNRNLANKYRVTSLPQSVVVDNTIKKKVGFSSFTNYRKWLGL
jgi:thioredoxin-related protein